MGRMVFQLSGAKRRDRIDINQAVVTLLIEAGAPLDGDALIARLGRYRGLGRFSLNHISADYVRLPDGRFGLLERDSPVAKPDLDHAASIIGSWCDQVGHGLHKNEVRAVLGEKSFACFGHEEIVLAYIRELPCLRLSYGGYIFPSSWEGPRRMNIDEAARSFVSEVADRTWSSAEAFVWVQAKTKRQDLTLEQMSHKLTTMENVIYDAPQRLWRVSAEPQDD